MIVPEQHARFQDAIDRLGCAAQHSKGSCPVPSDSTSMPSAPSRREGGGDGLHFYLCNSHAVACTVSALSLYCGSLQGGDLRPFALCARRSTYTTLAGKQAAPSCPESSLLHNLRLFLFPLSALHVAMLANARLVVLSLALAYAGVTALPQGATSTDVVLPTGTFALLLPSVLLSSHCTQKQS